MPLLQFQDVLNLWHLKQAVTVLCLAQQRAEHTVALNDLATGPEVWPKLESESNITDVPRQEKVILDPKI